MSIGQIGWASVLGLVATVTAASVRAEDPVFSGPQPGESLGDFEVLGVYDDQAGKTFQYWEQAGDRPTLLVFVHEITRPSVAVTRTVMDFAAKHPEKIYGSLVFLGEDPTSLETQLKRARHAMPKKTPVGISADGREGPGAYGLNRNVTLTVLVSKDRKVTANFALVQPSVQADVPKILQAVVAIVGGEVPSLRELGMARGMAAEQRAGDSADELRGLLRPVIQKDATAEQVDEAAKKAEAVFDRRPAAAREAGAIARRIIAAGRLENYGTKRAQEYLQKWAEKYPEAARPEKRQTPPE
jgi:hypothetical protein